MHICLCISTHTNTQTFIHLHTNVSHEHTHKHIHTDNAGDLFVVMTVGHKIILKFQGILILFVFEN